ncbi:MAG: flagellar type III secretion system pore protein FliP [Gammaproteobacteria bacterium]|nr:flagellar type III secretion system pore protein FliP [Gammaproteobacteria bacterium]
MRLLLVCGLLMLTGAAGAQQETIALAVAGADSESYSLSLQILLLMTLLTLLPAAILSTSAFVRIIIVLSILRQALGTAQTPPNQVLLGVALFLTFFVMAPVISDIHANAGEPYLNGDLTATEAFNTGIQPLRQFMLNQTRDSDIELFASIAGRGDITSAEALPMSIIIPSFMVSELKTAFQIGFLVFIPFLVIDLVVSSVLMSMGMMMLSPMLISLPFKIMLFVLVDGWALLLGTLASSFYT